MRPGLSPAGRCGVAQIVKVQVLYLRLAARSSKGPLDFN